jgi:hypothetical protein
VAGADEVLPFTGIARFDGSTRRYFLPAHQVWNWDIGPDGSVWLRAERDGRDGLFVITPDAVADSEPR